MSAVLLVLVEHSVWDGAIRLQWLHVALVDAMAGDMPGQKTDDSARAVMDVTPWWAACRADKTSLRGVGGMTTRSL